MRLATVRAALAALAITTGAASATPRPQPVHLATYYATWSAEAGPISGLDDKLAGVPSGVTEVLIAFMKPDAIYSGNLDLAGTGIEVPYSGPVLKASLEALRARIPGIKVLVSVGGEQYANWSRFNPGAIRRFIEDFGLDGIDLDFEPTAPSCRSLSGHISCGSDALLREVVEAARTALPRPLAVWLTATNTGAYGEGVWREARPTGGPTYGAFLPLLRDAGRRVLLDGISIMAYDAGPSYRPLEAYAAYRSHFEGPILIGFTSPPEAWGGHVYSVAETIETFRSAVKLGANGAMVFAIGKEPPTAPSPTTPSPDHLIAALIDAAGKATTD
ncbi:glycosyl hydrolase family 18 protein [Methylobacterium nodulans]|uniref:GH18 domain-containing protein n=1 Tax=Methylobacterium nodulans (strain LMG 21967 / CNCM I-2342 / ORS 2060) TaxID=460265 RepID=B8II95_METNO|nr:glycosyl hydrolase family 18 protein [Methylobacterium nodulans]ACL57964.1 conserved hypothetical protein [Methylobacterium nodulans ORS 2060]